MSFIAYLLTTFCTIAYIKAVPWDGAQPTSDTSYPGWNPNPTPAPLVRAETALLDFHDLRRRQDQGSICGYVRGQSGKPHSQILWPAGPALHMIDDPLACNGATYTVCTPISCLSALGCCNKWGADQCVVFTDCINSHEYTALCGGSSAVCPSNAQTITW